MELKLKHLSCLSEYKLVELRPCVCFALKVMHIEGVGEEDKQSNESVGVDRQPMVMTFCAGPELETDSLRFAQVVHVHVHRVPSIPPAG